MNPLASSCSNVFVNHSQQ